MNPCLFFFQLINSIYNYNLRSLLKRIGSILTAPPKITDKEYQEMKKLCVPATKGLIL